MDMGSNNLASQSGLDRKGYVDICEDIDRRYRLQFEGLDFAKAATGDNPMSLSNLFGNEDGKTGGSQAAPAKHEPPHREDFDAFGRGKGKGKGKNDGKCNTCGGEGRYSRDCLSTLPLSELVCHGCNGKGHFKCVYSTVDP